MNYGGSYMVPGMGTEFFTIENQFWFGRDEQQLWWGGLLSSATVDSGNTDYTTLLRPGLALGRITASQKLTQWNPYATDGSNYLVGFFGGQQNMTFMGTASDRFIGYILTKGNVYPSKLLIPGETTFGISGTDYEFLLREQMAGRFFTDDDQNGYNTVKEYTIGAAVTALTVTEAMNKTIFVTDSALGASCTLTLPVPRPGLEYYFAHPSTTAGTQLILDGPDTGEFWVAGAAANTIVLAGDNTTGLRKLRCVRVTDGAPDVFAYVLDGVAA